MNQKSILKYGIFIVCILLLKLIISCLPSSVQQYFGHSDLSNLASSLEAELKVGIFSESNGYRIIASSAVEHKDLGACVVEVVSAPCDASANTYISFKNVGSQDGRHAFVANNVTALKSKNIIKFITSINPSVRSIQFLSEVDAQTSIDKGASLITQTQLRNDLSFFTTDNLQGRLSGSQGHKTAVDYVIAELKKNNIEAGISNYLQPFGFNMPSLGNISTYNVIAKIEGKDPGLKDEFIVIGAHLDHAGTLQRGYTCSPGSIPGDSICNGADDNASGSTALLAIARALKSVEPTLKRSVLFIWFSGEEEGLAGSKYYINNPVLPLSKNKMMINLDMIGYLRQNSKNLEVIGGDMSQTSREVLKLIEGKYQQINFKRTSGAGGGSDHEPFMQKNIPILFYHTGVSSNPNYHKTSDHPEFIDYEGLESITKIAYESALALLRFNPASGQINLDDGVNVSSLLDTTTNVHTCLHPEHLNSPYKNIIFN